MSERAQAEVAERVGHTPGPWSVLDYADGNKGFIAVVSHATMPQEHIADVFPFGRRPGSSERAIAQHQANARLIAAAPDMLAALREAAMTIPPGTQLRIQINAAIAKAEGR